MTGQLTKIKVVTPSKKQVVLALLKQAQKGNMIAIKEVFDRIEGKASQPIQLANEFGKSFIIRSCYNTSGWYRSAFIMNKPVLSCRSIN